MERLERLRNSVYDFINMERPDQTTLAMAHLGYTAALAGLLGMRAGLNVELCQTAGYLHDVWLYLHHPLDEEEMRRHAEEGAKMVPYFMKVPNYTREEIDIVTRTIFNHDFHDRLDDPYSEVLKDADMLAHHINLCRFDTNEMAHPRVVLLGKMLGFAAQ